MKPAEWSKQMLVFKKYAIYVTVGRVIRGGGGGVSSQYHKTKTLQVPIFLFKFSKCGVYGFKILHLRHFVCIDYLWI